MSSTGTTDSVSSTGSTGSVSSTGSTCSVRTTSDQIDGCAVQLLSHGVWKGKTENTCGKKRSCHNWELNPYLLLVKLVH